MGGVLLVVVIGYVALYWRGLAAEVATLKSASLSKEDRLSLQLLEHTATNQVEGFRHAGWKPAVGIDEGLARQVEWQAGLTRKAVA